MASVQREAALALPAPKVWAALREVSQPHRLFAGVLTASRLEGDVRTVTFANGMIAKERIIDVDDARMRVAYSVIEGPFTYHGTSMQVVANGPVKNSRTSSKSRSRAIWAVYRRSFTGMV